MPMSYKELKSYFAENYKIGKITTYKESNKTYQKDFLAKMGGLKPKFFSLFKKAVTFTPINNIEDFISQYVCDVTDEINVEKMQENIRYYKQLEKEATSMQERQKELESIEELFKSYRIDTEKEYMQKFLSKRSSIQIEINRLEELRSQYEENENNIKKLAEKKIEIEEKKKELSECQKTKIVEEKNSDIGRKQDELELKIKETEEKLKEINFAIQRIINGLRSKVAKWRVNIREFLEQRDCIQEQEILNISERLKDNIEYLLSISENNIYDLEENVLIEIKEQMEKIVQYVNELFTKNKMQESELLESKEKLVEEIANLRVGIKPYDSNLIKFKNEVEEKLRNKFSKEIKVEILADLLEIKDLKWKEAIEGYINHQMFYLIISPEYYSEAANIYRHMAKEKEYTGFGIVDIEKIKNQKFVLEKNSLAEEVTTDNEFAKIYIEYLLGKVIKCEDTEEMRKYKSAITADCMLYKGFVLRNIKDNKFKFIGSKSIVEQIQIKEEILNEISISLEKIERIINITKELKSAEVFNDGEIKYIICDMQKIKEKPELINRKDNLKEELNSLDLTWIEKLREEIKRLDIEIENFSKEGENVLRKQNSIETNNKIIKDEKIPICEADINSKQKEIEYLFDEKWINEYGNPKFKLEVGNMSLEKILKRAEGQIYGIQKQKEIKEDSLINARTNYIKKYDFGYNVTNKDSNEEFSKDLREIKEIRLPEYIDKIKDSKEKSYEQFRDDFLSKIKANIDEVENQIEELNVALKNSVFGTDKYHFTVKPKQEYRRFYDMVKDNMLMEGVNLCSEQFNTRYKDEIEELFKKLTSSDIYDEGYNKNIDMYTDYKTYLSFDLIVTDKDGRNQHLSRTLNKKSGGETQTPFYISILASFAQIYRINKNRNDNTLRLIVFDEAFSKMDEDRIEESLKLLPKFQFQAIIAAPTERAGGITPLVRNTLCVIKKGTKTVVKEWGVDKSALE